MTNSRSGNFYSLMFKLTRKNPGGIPICHSENLTSLPWEFSQNIVMTVQSTDCMHI